MPSPRKARRTNPAGQGSWQSFRNSDKLNGLEAFEDTRTLLAKRSWEFVMGMPQVTAKKTKPTPPKNLPFDVQDFLDSTGVSRKVVEFKKKEVVFSQGDPAKNVLYIQKGGVRLSVVNETGKEAVVAVLGPGDFFGEGCLAGQPIRIGTATAITATAD
jgi:CRP-like cAMP-binding protein